MHCGSDYTRAMQAATQLSQIRRWAEELGFAGIGISDVDLSEFAHHFERYLARGFHGDMGYLERNRTKRLNPAELVPGTQRVICARMNYLPPDTEPLRLLDDTRTAYISRYALGRDYHKVLRKRLGQLAARINTAFGPAHSADSDTSVVAPRAFTDSAPVLEKALGAKAGLGWIGKHTLLLSKDAGSWFFLGEIFTTLPLPVNTEPEVDACGSCSACMTVCPTGAIVAPRQLDARRCISYLTIEHKGSIPVELRSAIGSRVFGCDDCQLYCPWNRYAQHSAEPDFQPRHDLEASSLLSLFEWDAATFAHRTEGSALRRISFELWRRNLAVALGNAPADPAIVLALERALPTASALVAEHLKWALAQQAQ